MADAAAAARFGHGPFERELAALREVIAGWVERSDPNMKEMLRWQFDHKSKLFRPLTVFSCYRAIAVESCPDWLVTTAQVVEMFHNVSLIIDDIVDNSDDRRGKATLHAKFGELPAYMVSGYIVAEGYDILARQTVSELVDVSGGRPASGSVARLPLPRDAGFTAGEPDNSSGSTIDKTGLVPELTRDAIEATGPVRFDIRLLSELLRRLSVAECVQWEHRQERLGLADWRYLAREDTGSMFEICATLGARSQKLRRFGRLLGMVYHGCDDVADLKGTVALGGGGDDDLKNGILTLPAALALADEKNEDVRRLFAVPQGEKRTPRPKEIQARLLHAFGEKLDDAERELDRIADLAKEEAQRCARAPELLIALVDAVRGLSS